MNLKEWKDYRSKCKNLRRDNTKKKAAKHRCAEKANSNGKGGSPVFLIPPCKQSNCPKLRKEQGYAAKK